MNDEKNTNDEQQRTDAVDINSIVEIDLLLKEIPTQVDDLKKIGAQISKGYKAAESARNSANKKDGSHPFWKWLTGNKASIENLQEAQIAIANAVLEEAEAQRLSFEFQKKLAELTTNLFGLGLFTLATNRIVVQEVEKRLKGASEAEISDLARRELNNVLQQLRAQQDILSKIEKHTAKLTKQDSDIEVLNNMNKHFERIQEMHTNDINEQGKKIDTLMDATGLQLKVQDRHTNELAEHDKNFDTLKSTSELHEKMLKEMQVIINDLKAELVTRRRNFSGLAVFISLITIVFVLLSHFGYIKFGPSGFCVGKCKKSENLVEL